MSGLVVRCFSGPGSGRGFRVFRQHVALLADTGGLAGAATQVIELGATHHAATHDFDAVDAGGIKREDTLHAFAVAEFADGEA